jgi:hypothetical protein
MRAQATIARLLQCSLCARSALWMAAGSELLCAYYTFTAAALQLSVLLSL